MISMSPSWLPVHRWSEGVAIIVDHIMVGGVYVTFLGGQVGSRAELGNMAQSQEQGGEDRPAANCKNES
jgi:hypothetical protein